MNSKSLKIRYFYLLMHDFVLLIDKLYAIYQAIWYEKKTPFVITLPKLSEVKCVVLTDVLSIETETAGRLLR